MFTRLSDNSINKGGREKSAKGPKAERREVLTVFNFIILKTSQRFILQELSHVRKRRNDTKTCHYFL